MPLSEVDTACLIHLNSRCACDGPSATLRARNKCRVDLGNIIVRAEERVEAKAGGKSADSRE